MSTDRVTEDPATPLAGMLLAEETLATGWFAVLAAFVAINTIMYVVLALIKTLPEFHPGDWLPRNYVRSQTRSIHPDAPEGRDAPQRPRTPLHRDD
jgi:hypothetical protein